jgi:hypothetical protein
MFKRSIVFVLCSVLAFAVSPTIVARQTFTAQTGNIAQTAIYAPSTTGLFRMNFVLTCSNLSNDICAGATLSYSFTDQYGSHTVNLSANAANESPTFLIHGLANDAISAAVQVSTSGCAPNCGTYDAYFVVERIGD